MLSKVCAEVRFPTLFFVRSLSHSLSVCHSLSLSYLSLSLSHFLAGRMTNLIWVEESCRFDLKSLEILVEAFDRNFKCCALTYTSDQCVGCRVKETTSLPWNTEPGAVWPENTPDFSTNSKITQNFAQLGTVNPIYALIWPHRRLVIELLNVAISWRILKTQN